MGVNLSGRSFLKLLDLTTEEIEYLLKLSKNFKDMKRAGVPHRYLEGKNIVLLADGSIKMMEDRKSTRLNSSHRL